MRRLVEVGWKLMVGRECSVGLILVNSVNILSFFVGGGVCMIVLGEGVIMRDDWKVILCYYYYYYY